MTRVGILARLRVIDPSFFLWTHKFKLKLTITRPLGRACIHNGVKISPWTRMYSQWSKNIPWKIIVNVPFLSTISKYRVHVLN